MMTIIQVLFFRSVSLNCKAILFEIKDDYINIFK